MMAPVLIYAFAAAIVGGIDSPIGAVVGGLALGVLLNLLSYLSQYDAFDWFPEELRCRRRSSIILVSLLVRPQGIFGEPRGIECSPPALREPRPPRQPVSIRDLVRDAYQHRFVAFAPSSWSCLHSSATSRRATIRTSAST